MSRRASAGPGARPLSPDSVFARRRGELPYQIYFEISNIGRNVESSKKRCRWKFCFGEEGQEHEVTLVHSLMSGKKRTFFDGECINEAQKVSTEWAFAWSSGAHLLRVGINFEEYSLVIDGIPFKNFARRDPYLAAQLEATKRDSMRSLQADEQRRFERLGYNGRGGGGGNDSGARSRTAERRRPSQTSSAGSAVSRSSSVSRAVSSGRSRRGEREDNTGRRRRSSPTQGTPALRRSSSVEYRNGGRRSPDSGPLPSKRGGQQSAGSTNSKAPAAAQPAKAAPPQDDILSADPSSLEVKGFELNVPESTFDPLNSKYAGAGRSANGNAPEPHGPGGGFGAGGGNGGFGPAPGGGQDDAAAVLQLGMEFGAMEMNAGMQQPQQMQYMQQQQSAAPLHDNPFDQAVYQQYDDSGFPLPSQQTQSYTNPPQQPQQHDFGFPGDSGVGGGYSTGGYGGQGQGQMQQGQGVGGGGIGSQQGLHGAGAAGAGEETTGRELSVIDPKASTDPWDAARSGMVNIDDITDTKHLPKVEVKPFTDDDRPLADLVREAPVKEKKTVMIERPEPAPTHMAVAIVPVPQQGGFPGQPQGAYPQQQPPNGNPFQQPMQLTQFGHQAQPILYTKPDDPFYNL